MNSYAPAEVRGAVVGATTARIMIAQLEVDESDLTPVNGVFIYKDPGKVWNKVDRILGLARSHTVNAVVLPELAVTADYIPSIQSWAAQTGAIVIAGSHYHLENGVLIARCPVVFPDKVHFIHKRVPAPIEKSPVRGEGLRPGTITSVFTNTAIGDFGVLICSDYLDEELRGAVLRTGIQTLFVPAFQKDSELYHRRMGSNCEESRDGVYLAYSNTYCGALADGRSSLFGQMDRIYLEKLQAAGLTDLQPKYKLSEVVYPHGHLIADLDLNQRKPSATRFVHTAPNVIVFPISGQIDQFTSKFLKLISHDDERYERLLELYVEPAEYSKIIEKLDQRKLIFIIGDPGIGKTYTAARLLRHYYDRGYKPFWYTGLAREEREMQRAVLESFRPENKQAIYFEDPFGRIGFERKDSLFRFFSPLLDDLIAKDARVIITSRRDVFERFSEEHLSRGELDQLCEDMNIVKPSYDPEQLKSILEKIARGRCAWFEDGNCRAIVDRAILRGDLSTPITIYDFTRSTEDVKKPSVLEERLEKRRENTALVFAQELKSIDDESKLALGMILFFGKRLMSTLGDWYEQVRKDPEIRSSFTFRKSFLSAVRSQLGHRIEQYGPGGQALRFAHPYYEEAFYKLAARDEEVFELTVSLLRVVDGIEPGSAFRSVIAARHRLPELCADLITRLGALFPKHASLRERVQLIRALVAAASEGGGQNYRGVLEDIFKIEEALEEINEMADFEGTGNAIRLLLNAVKSKVVPLSNGGIADRDWLCKKFDWPKLWERCRTSPLYSHVIDALQFASELDGARVKEFLNTLRATGLFLNWARPDKSYQWKIIARNCEDASLLANVREIHEVPRVTIRKWILANSLAGVGIVADRGALVAVRRGRSLLPVGVSEVIGEFRADDIVSLFDENGVRVGAGVTAYSSEDISLVRGQHSRSIGKILGTFRGSSILTRKAIVISPPALQ